VDGLAHGLDRRRIGDVGLNEKCLRPGAGQFARDSGSGFRADLSYNNLCVFRSKATCDRSPNSLARSRHDRNFSIKPSWHFLAEGRDQCSSPSWPERIHMMNGLYSSYDLANGQGQVNRRIGRSSTAVLS
jgi:hypothetical protein